MSNTFNNDLAASGNFGSILPIQLFAGDKPVSTSNGLVKRNQTLAKFTVVAYDPTNLLVPWNPAGADSTKNIVGVTCQPIVTGATDDTQSISFYDACCFNFDLATFPGGVTLAQVKAAQAGKTLTFEKLYG